MIEFAVAAGGFAAMVLAGLSQRGRAADPVDRIDSALPQTQCGQCGYAGCRPYAAAIAEGTADINQCPPGRDAVIRKLARLTGRRAKPLNPANGAPTPRRVALIEEEHCIGCTLCIQACPTDAIVGAPKLMHTVLAADCTGCSLCIPPCPVDCIVMVAPPPVRWSGLGGEQRLANRWRALHEARGIRLELRRREQVARLAAKGEAKLAAAQLEAGPGAERKRAIIEAALRRARERLASPDTGSPAR